MSNFETKDSGKREDLAGGMVRDTSEGKADYTLIRRGPLFRRWAELLTRGAVKYGKHNWCLALEATDVPAREKTKARFHESAARHFEQWLRGDTDEDHAAAVIFNMNGYEAMLETDPVAKAKDANPPADALSRLRVIAERIPTRREAYVPLPGERAVERAWSAPQAMCSVDAAGGGGCDCAACAALLGGSL